LGTVGTLPGVARENSVRSPAVVIIGSVCALSGRYSWFGRKPPPGKHVVVARATPGPSKLSARLRELGFYVTETPGAEIVPLTAPGCRLRMALEAINDYAWAVFTSGVGVNVFFDYLIGAGFDIRLLSHLKVACVGAETEKEVRKRGVITAYRPDEFNGAALAQGLISLVKNGEKLLIARAKDGAGELTRLLSGAGIDYDDVAVYEKARSIGKQADFDADFAAFTSSSAVEWFAKTAGGLGFDFGKVRAVCIGEQTAATARAFGMDVCVSAEATIESVAQKILELMRSADRKGLVACVT